jgi:quinol monooxygenase YgiN
MSDQRRRTDKSRLFGLVVRFELREASEKSFDALVRDTVARVRSEEPGTLMYACHEVQGNPQARIFYELYEDEGAFAAHEEQEHVKHFLNERKRYLTSPPRVEFLRPTLGKGVDVG